MIKAEFPQVILIENNANFGFGAANNRALKFAKGKYVLYLNSDTVLLNNAVKLFFDYWENAEDKEQIGALSAWLLKNNRITHSFGDYPTLRNMLYTLYRGLLSSAFGNLICCAFCQDKKEKKTAGTGVFRQLTTLIYVNLQQGQWSAKNCSFVSKIGSHLFERNKCSIVLSKITGSCPNLLFFLFKTCHIPF